MTQWFSADWHVGHKRILDFEPRPFADLDEMAHGLIANWNARVAVDDVGWMLGDFAMGPIGESLEVVGQLNGRVRLVCGNHDRPHPIMTADHLKAQTWAHRYLDAGFDSVSVLRREGVVLNNADGTWNRHVYVSHFPYEPTGIEAERSEDRFAPHRPRDTGRVLLCGHVHGQWPTMSGGRVINVGVDVRDYAPVSEVTLLGELTNLD